MMQKTYDQTAIIKRSVKIAGHATSVSLEQPFWDLLQKIAQQKGLSLNQLIADVDSTPSSNLSSALRLYVLNYLQN